MGSAIRSTDRIGLQHASRCTSRFPGVADEFTKAGIGICSRGMKCRVFTSSARFATAGFWRLPVHNPDACAVADGWARDACGWRGWLLVIVFLAELTTVPPTRKRHAAAAHRKRLRRAALPDYEPVKAASCTCARATPSSVRRRTGDPAPIANRLWHGEFPMDTRRGASEVSDFPRGNLPVLPADTCARIIIASARSLRLCARRRASTPAGAAARCGAAQRPVAIGPTWYLASRLSRP